MAPNPPEDPEAVPGTLTATSMEGAMPTLVQSLTDSRCYRIEPTTTIGLDRRHWLTAQLIDQLQPTTIQRAMRMSVIYLVERATGQPGQPRLRTYLRFAIDFDAASDDIEEASQQARRQLKQTVVYARETLAMQYELTELPTASLAAMLHANGCHMPTAELGYTQWTPTMRWLAPAHIQPTLDQLLDRPGSSAIEITVERVATPGPAPAPLRLQTLAYGEGADDAARAPLVDEYRGRGVLVVNPARHDIAPRAQWVCPVALTATSSDDQRQQPEQSAASLPSLVDVTLTPYEAGFLVPLPMLLGHV